MGIEKGWSPMPFFGSGKLSEYALGSGPPKNFIEARTVQHHQEPQSPYRRPLERGGDCTLRKGRANRSGPRTSARQSPKAQWDSRR